MSDKDIRSALLTARANAKSRATLMIAGKKARNELLRDTPGYNPKLETFLRFGDVRHEVGSPERQQAFDQWGGAPERWYHGTSKDVDFPKFKIGRHGAWFARDPQEASKYAEQNDSQGHRYEDGKFVPTNTRSRVIPVHLKLGKSHTGPMPDNFLGAQNYKKAQSEWFDQLRAQGYDSWTPEGQNVAVILKDPTQIKSAIGNRGTYDPNEADIGKAEGGPIDTYHGSPHDFDKFDFSKIGTGEGAQTYGHGLYLADQETVARQYKMPAVMAASPEINGVKNAKSNYEYFRDGPTMVDKGSKKIVRMPPQSHEAAIKSVYDDLTETPEKAHIHRHTLNALTKFAEKGEWPELGEGRLYDVRLHADPESLLDLDRPMAEQSPRVKKALALRPTNTGIGGGPKLYSESTGLYIPDKPDIARSVVPVRDKGAAASMEKAGIPGVRYYDGYSRSRGDGSRNYVVFPTDKEILEITRKRAAGGEVDAPATRTISLKRPEQPAVTAFMNEYEEDTHPHPFFPGSRFLNTQTGGDPGGDFAMLDLRAARYEKKPTVHLSSIMALEPGKGQGKQGLKYVTDLADKHGVHLTGYAKQFGNHQSPTLSTAKLKQWYARNGFDVSKVGNMLRPPGGVPSKTSKPRKSAGGPVGHHLHVTAQAMRDRYNEGGAVAPRAYLDESGGFTHEGRPVEPNAPYTGPDAVGQRWRVDDMLVPAGETAPAQMTPRMTYRGGQQPNDYRLGRDLLGGGRDGNIPFRSHWGLAQGGAAENKDLRRALMIARDQRALLRRVANIYPGPGGGMDPSPGGGGYSGPGGGKYIGPSRYAAGGKVPSEPGKAAIPKGRARRFHYTDAKNVPHILKEGIQLSKSTGRRVGDPVAVWSTPDNPYEYSVPNGKALVEFHDNPETYTRNPYASPHSVPPENIMAVHLPWHSHYRYALEEGLTPEDLRGVQGEEYQQAADALERTKRATGGSVPPFKLHSGAAKVIGAKGQAKATPQQYAALPGIKPDELKHSKFDTLGSKALPREEVIKHLEDNRLPIEVTQLGGEGRNTSTKFSKETLPGGKNYREVLLHLPPHGAGVLDELTDKRNYQSSHWDEPNVLAHIRMSDRVGPNGEKVLHVEEIQSDWGQQGRESGFKDPALEEKLRIARDEATQRVEDACTELRKGMPDTDEVNRVLNPLLTAHKKAYQEHIAAQNGLPRGPYVDNTQKWTDLALKRVLHEAAHGGYDRIVFTPGEEQNKRYDLSSQVKNIQYYPDIGYLHATTHDDRGVEHNDVKPDDLAKHIGKEAADRILKQGMQRYEGRGKLGGEFYHELEGEGLKVGGEGMRKYYDEIVPSSLQKLAKKHDPQAQMQLHSHDLPTDEVYRTGSTKGHSLDVTPQMRDSIKAKGFNSFKRGGSAPDDDIVRGQLGSMSPQNLLRRASLSAGHPEQELLAALRQSGPREPEKQGISSLRSPELIERATATIVPNKRIAVTPPPRLSPADLYKRRALIIGGMSDRSGAGYDVSGADDVDFGENVSALGGVDYNRMPHSIKNQLGWASARQAISGLATPGKRAEEAGADQVMLTPKLMGLQALDQSHMMMKAASHLLRNAPVTAADAKAFNEHVRSLRPSMTKKKPNPEPHMPDFPGIKHPKLYEYLMNQSMPDRAQLIKAMDAGAWNKKGIPNPAAIRMAFTKPELMRAPTGTPGAFFATFDPNAPHHEDTDPRHPSYEIGLRGENVGGFDRVVPKELMFQKYFDAPENQGRRPADLMNAYMKKPVSQVANQQWLDRIMPTWEKTPQGWRRGGKTSSIVDRALKLTAKKHG